MAHAFPTVIQTSLPAWGGFQAQTAGGAAAAHGAHASPQLKRSRPNDDVDDLQQQWQQRCSIYGDVHQPPTRRRRLDSSSGGGGSGYAAEGAAPVPLPTPQPAQPLLAPQPQPQCQPQPSLKRAGSSMSDLELSDAEGDGCKQPQQQRQRTGQPEYRLVLPEALAPSIPSALLPGAPSPAWSPSLPPAPDDAFAVVPWCPPLVSADEMQQQQEQQRQEQQGRVRAAAALGGLEVAARSAAPVVWRPHAANVRNRFSGLHGSFISPPAHLPALPAGGAAQAGAPAAAPAAQV